MIFNQVSLNCLYCNKAKIQIISGMRKVYMNLGTEVIKKTSPALRKGQKDKLAEVQYDIL